MIDCDFRVKGRDFCVDEFLRDSPWQSRVVVIRKGDPTGVKSRPVVSHSGFRIEFPELESLGLQLDAIQKFIEKDYREISRLREFPSADEVEFRVGLYWYEDTVAWSLELTPEFLASVAHAGIKVGLDLYATSVDEPT